MPLQPNLLLGFWQYFSIGAPHCLPPFLHRPQSFLVRSNQQGASATGLPLLSVSVHFLKSLSLLTVSLGHFLLGFARASSCPATRPRTRRLVTRSRTFMATR